MSYVFGGPDDDNWKGPSDARGWANECDAGGLTCNVIEYSERTNVSAGFFPFGLKATVSFWISYQTLSSAEAEEEASEGDGLADLRWQPPCWALNPFMYPTSTFQSPYFRAANNNCS